MSYTLTTFDATRTYTIQDLLLDGPGQASVQTPIILPGRGATNYGQPFAQSLLNHLENFANTTPTRLNGSVPLRGQLWFDTSQSMLRVNVVATGSAPKWVNVSTPFVGATAPSNPSTGDLWYDFVNQELKAWNGTSWIIVGPASATPTTIFETSVTTGASNSYAVTIAGATYTVNDIFTFTSDFANTGPATLNINSLGPVPIVKQDDATALVGGEIPNNAVLQVVYNGSAFQMLGTNPNFVNGLFASAGSTSSGTGSANYLTLAGNVSGRSPTIQAVGTDANISLNLVPKALGALQVNGTTLTDQNNNIPVMRLGSGTNASSSTFWRGDGIWSKVAIASGFNAGSVSAPGFALATESGTGLFQSIPTTLSIAARGVEVIRLATTSNAVNYLQLTPSATSVAVQIGAQGTDNNISLNLVTKGTGILQVNGVSLAIYLGLGTAATFNVGTAPNNVVQLNGGAQLPAVSGALLTNLPVSASVSGLLFGNYSGVPNTSIFVQATIAVLTNPSGGSVVSINPAVIIDLTTFGANGMDLSARPTSGWVYVYLISNGTITAGLASISYSSPTMPVGYTYRYRVGAMYCDGSQNLKQILHNGSRARYIVTPATNTANLPLITNTATSGWTSFALTSFIPATAATVIISSAVSGNASVSIAPNSNYAAANDPTNPAPYGVVTSGVEGDYAWTTTTELMLETSSTIWIDSSGVGIRVLGWEEGTIP